MKTQMIGNPYQNGSPCVRLHLSYSRTRLRQTKSPTRLIDGLIRLSPSHSSNLATACNPRAPASSAPAKIILHASSLRPRTLRGRRKASRLRACSLPPQGGHGAYSCLRPDPHCKSLAARAVSTRGRTPFHLCCRRQPRRRGLCSHHSRLL